SALQSRGSLLRAARGALGRTRTVAGASGSGAGAGLPRARVDARAAPRRSGSRRCARSRGASAADARYYAPGSRLLRVRRARNERTALRYAGPHGGRRRVDSRGDVDGGRSRGRATRRALSGAHVGPTAHVPVSRSVRPDALEGAVSDADADADTDADGGSGILYLVSTPIGNMGDFSFRAVETLNHVALVLAEDTRHTRHLLDRYEISTPAASYHEHNEAKRTPSLVRRLVAGESLALVSDAGTPLLSDPGARLVRAAIDAGVAVVPIPGSSALLAALVASGLD